MKILTTILYVAVAACAIADVTPRKEGDFFAASFLVRATLFKFTPEHVQLPLPKNQLLPQYPREMRRAGIQGAVVVRFELDNDGRVKTWSVTKEAVKGFAESVKAVVAEWRFGPAEDFDGKPVPITLDYEFLFLLDVK